MFFVYVLRSQKDGRFYVGLTSDVSRRLSQHNKAQNKSTKPYVPWDLFFVEEYSTRLEARKREVYLKSGVGKEYIKSKWSGSSVG
ncbi:MAG: GIY-YIG nuclease family protein [Sphingobacteriales bacterium]|nr:MAG: GIY-YIG nuclease family protein [Sphingobacteriales bacterium]